MRDAWIAAADLAALMVAAIEKPELAGRIIPVSGPEALSGHDLAAAFSQALGRPYQYRGLPPAEFGAILDRVFGPGACAGAAAVYGPLWEMPEPPALAVDMQPVLAQLPVQMQTLRAWIADHAARRAAIPAPARSRAIPAPSPRTPAPPSPRRALPPHPRGQICAEQQPRLV